MFCRAALLPVVPYSVPAVAQSLSEALPPALAGKVVESGMSAWARPRSGRKSIWLLSIGTCASAAPLAAPKGVR